MKRLTILFQGLLIQLLLAAQSGLPPIDIPSPNSSSLGRFGDVPVSYYTGKADISIPLYELTVKGVTLPISLQYDATGVLMNSLPGWLGHNWSLNAGGCITRVVRGLCDEFVCDTEYPLKYQYTTTGYFHAYQTLAQCIEANQTNNDNYQMLLEYNAVPLYDFNPDIFHFNFMGHTGKFFLGQDGEWKVESDDNLEVILDVGSSESYILPFITHYPNSEHSQMKTIKGFTIRDDNGLVYEFGGSTDYIEYTMELFYEAIQNCAVPWTANTWYLRNVYDRFGNLLFAFEYERGEYVAQLANFVETTNYYVPSEGLTYIGAFNYDIPYDGTLNAPVYLKSITTLDGRIVEFNSEYADVSFSSIYSRLYSESNYLVKLADKILIKHGISPNNNEPFYYLQTYDTDAAAYQKTGSFLIKLSDPLSATALRKLTSIRMKDADGRMFPINYSFLYDYVNRMHLMQVTIEDSTLTSIGKYSLTYQGFNSVPSDYLTRAIDHWGYYRQSEYQSVSDTTDFVNFYNQRSPNSTTAQYGMLTKVVYPTGGCSVFTYESNDYSLHMSDNRQVAVYEDGIAGGLRIKSISEYEDANGQTLLKRRDFSYFVPGFSDLSSGQLFSKPKYYWNHWEARKANNTASIYLDLFRCSSILPLSNSFGPHIGYTYVKENFQDGTARLYHYSNFADAPDLMPVASYNPTVESPYTAYSERGYKRGKLLSVSVFKNGTVKQSTDYIYLQGDPDTFCGYASSIKTNNYYWTPVREDIYFGEFFLTGGLYKIYYPKYDVAQAITKTYEENQTLTDTLTYEKYDRTQTSSFGGYSHQADVRYIVRETHSRKGHSIAKTYTYPFSYGQGTTERRLSDEQFYLQPIGSSRMINGTTCERKVTEYMTYGSLIVPACNKESKGGMNPPETVVNYISYSPTGTLTRYQEQGQPVTTLVWDATDTRLMQMTKGTQFTTSYNYDNLWNVTSITDERGNTLNYEYDAFGRLSAIRDRNGKLIRSFEYNYRNH